MRKAATRRVESAFTMIELIIGMVLLAIAIGMIGTMIVQALSGSSGSTSGATSDAAIARVVARFQDDLAVTETEQRAQRLVREQVSLDAALRQGADASSDSPTIQTGNVDLEDIVVATPTRLVLQADVERTTAGVECVTWETITEGTTYRIARTVRGAAPRCAGGGGATISQEDVMTGRSDAEDAVMAPFSYDLLCNRTLCAGAPAAAAGSECAPWQVTDVGSDRRDLRRVVAVRGTFVAHTGRAATQARSSTAMSIRSRDEHMWRTALGC